MSNETKSNGTVKVPIDGAKTDHPRVIKMDTLCQRTADNLMKIVNQQDEFFVIVAGVGGHGYNYRTNILPTGLPGLLRGLADEVEKRNTAQDAQSSEVTSL